MIDSGMIVLNMYMYFYKLSCITHVKKTSEFFALFIAALLSSHAAIKGLNCTFIGAIPTIWDQQ